MCFDAVLLPQSYQYPDLAEGADSIGGRLCGDKECSFCGVNNSGSLEAGGGKRCLECASVLRSSGISRVLHSVSEVQCLHLTILSLRITHNQRQQTSWSLL